MFGRVYSGGLVGVDAYKIEVEVDCCGGIGQIHIVGLPDASVKESQERVRSAIKASEFLMPPAKKWIVNLAPGDTRKEGPAFDLPIAVGILTATGYLPAERLSNFWMIGELSLDGSVRGVNGALPVVMSCRSAGVENIILPEANCPEAELVEGINIFPVAHLKEVLEILRNPGRARSIVSSARLHFERNQKQINIKLDFAEVKGQQAAKRALMIAAAGRHNILMVGPPGAGKSMLAQRLPGIMPPLEFSEAVDLTKLYSVAGLLKEKRSIVNERPFRAPHHSASMNGLVGGGTYPKPGEISLSHHGVLFLDELTEFPRHYLDAMRQPLENGEVTISRANQTLTFPASFLLVGACNPCPCGYRGDLVRACSCTMYQADRYWGRLSGPFLDRIDLQVDVARLGQDELVLQGGTESSASMRLLVMRAIEMQKNRYGNPERTRYNAQMQTRELRTFCQIDELSQTILSRAVSTLGLSARAYDRVLRIARTIADLDASDRISSAHIAEAIRYRTLSRLPGH